ncbi:hypothetical protein ACLOJK_013995 [Asimina triloba]
MPMLTCEQLTSAAASQPGARFLPIIYKPRLGSFLGSRTCPFLCTPLQPNSVLTLPETEQSRTAIVDGESPGLEGGGGTKKDGKRYAKERGSEEEDLGGNNQLYSIPSMRLRRPP